MRKLQAPPEPQGAISPDPEPYQVEGLSGFSPRKAGLYAQYSASCTRDIMDTLAEAVPQWQEQVAPSLLIGIQEFPKFVFFSESQS